MTNKQILKKAIRKAVKNGFRYDDTPRVEWLLKDQIYYCLIYDLDFAKAFWGEETGILVDGKRVDGWGWNLQQMVLEENPLKYLEKSL